MDKRKDPSDERKGDIAKETECACEGGCCSWHDNTPARSDEDSEYQEKPI